MTSWMIVAVGFAVAMLLGVVLNHRVEMARLKYEHRGTSFDAGYDAGLQAAATLLEPQTVQRSGDYFAATIRASRRTS